MDDERIILVFRWCRTGETIDLEVPQSISANELIIGLANGLKLEMNTAEISSCYLKTENPVALLKGNKLLSEYGLRNGTVINYTL